MAAMHNVGPNMADFATFIRDCVISVTGKYDVTEKTQLRMNVAKCELGCEFSRKENVIRKETGKWLVRERLLKKKI
jgi:hypothetical protein